MIEIEYITDKNGQKTVVIPIKLWHKTLPAKNAPVGLKGNVHIWR